ncbi:MAG: cysteine desulfurase family protein [Tissierellia bacterium]|nr:cysteine desulfurase family protein [Tissierellia bacterium]
MDNAATTPVNDTVLETMMPYFNTFYGNPSSVYSLGQKSKEAIENSRFSIAHSLRCQPTELYFTSGGTESDNWALKSSLINSEKNHIITTSVEHPAILSTCRELEKQGLADITYLPVDSKGEITLEDVKKAIRKNTCLVSVMYANNEVGTIYPIEEIGEYCREKGILFHVDGVQALGNLSIRLDQLPVDMMSFSAHKIYGPKGIGLLYLRDGVELPSFIRGGEQERGKRGGTENVPLIVGFAKAVEMAVTYLEDHQRQMEKIRNYLWESLDSMEGIYINGPEKNRLPGNLNISIENIKDQMILPFLDMNGICVSQGSACSAGSIEPSHVLYALGRRGDLLKNSLRISVGYQNTIKEAEEVIKAIQKGVTKFRK